MKHESILKGQGRGVFMCFDQNCAETETKYYSCS